MSNGGPGVSAGSAAGSSSNPDDADLRVAFDDDDAMIQVTRVRLVQFQKNTEEPMGITLKVIDELCSFISSLLRNCLLFHFVYFDPLSAAFGGIRNEFGTAEVVD